MWGAERQLKFLLITSGDDTTTKIWRKVYLWLHLSMILPLWPELGVGEWAGTKPVVPRALCSEIPSGGSNGTTQCWRLKPSQLWAK